MDDCFLAEIRWFEVQCTTVYLPVDVQVIFKGANTLMHSKDKLPSKFKQNKFTKVPFQKNITSFLKQRNPEDA